MGTVMTDVTAETTDVLQRLIRNSCVNEGTPESGHEIRSKATCACPASR